MIEDLRRELGEIRGHCHHIQHYIEVMRKWNLEPFKYTLINLIEKDLIEILKAENNITNCYPNSQKLNIRKQENTSTNELG